MAKTEGLRIVLIEDNLDLANSTRMLLALHGHIVWIASNGHQGVRLAKQVTPHLVICDIGLPGMTGYEVVRTLRADPTLVSTRIVAMTALSSDDDVARSKQAGFEMHLVKPVSPSDLFRVVEAPQSPSLC
jgi:CheY-like chemotaxis protein